MGLFSKVLKTEIKPDDRRRWQRVAARSRVSVMVVSAPEVPSLEGKRYYCWTEDISAGGLRFRVHSKVPLAAILKLDVQLEGSPQGSFLHMGRVAWEQEFEENGLVSRWLGVEITETLGGEDRFWRWQNLIEGLRTTSQ